MMERDIDLLDIDLVQMKRNVQKDCQFEDIVFDCSIDDMKEIMNKAVEIEVEEYADRNHRERGLVRKRNDEGTYISIKNIHISMGSILEALNALNDLQPLTIAIFLYNLFQQMRVEINRLQMAVYMILYEEGRRVNITDENILYIIQNQILEYHYENVDRDKIMDTVSELYNKKLIDIENGVYRAVEKVYC